MRKLLHLLLLVFLMNIGFAQDFITSSDANNLPNNGNPKFSPQYTNLVLDGASTSGNARAPVGTFRYERGVYLISAAEMQAAGVPTGVSFTTLGFKYSAGGSISVAGTFQVYFMNTSDVTNTRSTTWATAITGMTQVDFNGADVIPTGTTFDHTLNTPGAFTYTGGGIYVAWEFSNPSNPLSTGAVVFCNTTIASALLGAQSSTSMPTTLGASNFRPDTRLGYVMNNDAAVKQIYALGKLDNVFSVPYNVTALIANSGDNTLTSLNVTLNITGANTFSDVQNIASLAPGATTIVTFAAWSPAALGSNTLTVTVPADDYTGNNSKTYTVETTTGAVSHNDASNASTLIGYNTGSGTLLSRYYLGNNAGSPASITGVKAFIASKTGKIYGVVLNSNGVVIAKSADYNVQPADSLTWKTFVFPIPVSVTNQDIYVGIAQTATTTWGYFPLGTQSESPARPNAFYGTALTGGSFSNYTTLGRYMIEAVLSTGAAQIWSPEGLNMPGAWDTWSNPPTINSLAGIQKVGGTLLPREFKATPPNVLGSRIYNTLINVQTSGGDIIGGTYEWLFTSGPSGGYFNNKWCAVTVVPNTIQTYATSGANNSATVVDGKYYTVNWLDQGYASTKAIFMPTSAAPVSISAVSDNYSIVGNGVDVTVTITTSAAPSAEELIFVRYTTDGWATWAITQATGALTTWLATIPGASVIGNANNQYYVFTSTLALSALQAFTSGADIDLATVAVYNSGNNMGLNYYLPVELTSFTARAIDRNVNLNWATASEISNSGFEILRKADNDNNWITAGFVKGAGNSNTSKEYSFIDTKLNSGNYSYKLKQVDNNGRFSYSEIINVEVSAPNAFALNQNYPNPFNPSTKISYQVPVDAKVKIELYSITGQKIADLVNQDQSSGYYSIEVNSSSFKNLSSGVYIYKMTAIDKSGFNFINVKKMMMLK